MKRELLLFSCLYILTAYCDQYDLLDKLPFEDKDNGIVVFQMPNNFNFTLKIATYFVKNQTYGTQMHMTDMTDDSTAMLLFTRCYICEDGVISGRPDYYLFNDSLNQFETTSLKSFEPDPSDSTSTIDDLRSVFYNNNSVNPLQYLIVQMPVVTSFNDTMLIVYTIKDLVFRNYSVFASYYDTKEKTWSTTYKLWSDSIFENVPIFSSIHVDYPLCAVVTHSGHICYFVWQEENWNCTLLYAIAPTREDFDDITHNIRLSSNNQGNWLAAVMNNSQIIVFSTDTIGNKISQWKNVTLQLQISPEIDREFVTVAYTKIAWFVAWCETDITGRATIRYVVSKLNMPLDFYYPTNDLGNFTNTNCREEIRFLKLHPASLDSYPLYMFVSVGRLVVVNRSNNNLTWHHSVRLVERIGSEMTNYTYHLVTDNQNYEAYTKEYLYYSFSNANHSCFDYDPHYSLKNGTVLVTKTLSCFGPDLEFVNKIPSTMILFGNVPIDSGFIVEEQINNDNIISTPNIPISRNIVVVGPTLINDKANLSQSSLQITGSLTLKGSNVTVQDKTTLNVTGDFIVNENSQFYFDDSTVSIGGCLNFTGTLIITKNVSVGQDLYIANYSGKGCEEPKDIRLSFKANNGENLCASTTTSNVVPRITSLIIQFRRCSTPTPTPIPIPTVPTPTKPTDTPTHTTTPTPTDTPTNTPTPTNTTPTNTTPTNPDGVVETLDVNLIIGVSVAAGVIILLIVVGLLLIFFVKPIRETIMPFKNQNKFMNNKKRNSCRTSKTRKH